MPIDATTTAKGVAQAEELVRSSKERWERHGLRRVSDQELAQADAALARCEHQLRALRSLGWRWAQLRFAAFWLVYHTRVGTWGWAVGGLIAGTAGVTAAAPFLVLLSRSPMTVLPLLGVAFLLAGSAAVAVLLSGGDLGEEVARQQQQVADRQQEGNRLQEHLLAWQFHRSSLLKAREAQRQYERAVEQHSRAVQLHAWAVAEQQELNRAIGQHQRLVEEHARLLGEHERLARDHERTLAEREEQARLAREHERLVEDHRRLLEVARTRRQRLKQTDWRPLRDREFEDFVAEIFEGLGYSVQKTKVTGDQGVDLVVTGRGRRIAVQAKGYEGGVGNASVQQAYAGMTFYGCEECAVVTNSHFTSGAVALAKACRCRLVPGGDIPRLIDGELY